MLDTQYEPHATASHSNSAPKDMGHKLYVLTDVRGPNLLRAIRNMRPRARQSELTCG